jgi:hypothetical protein
MQLKPGVRVYKCNSSTGRLKQEDQEFKTSLGYIVRPCLKKSRRQVPVAHTCNLRYLGGSKQEAEIRRTTVQG